MAVRPENTGDMLEIMQTVTGTLFLILIIVYLIYTIAEAIKKMATPQSLKEKPSKSTSGNGWRGKLLNCKRGRTAGANEGLPMTLGMAHRADRSSVSHAETEVLDRFQEGYWESFAHSRTGDKEESFSSGRGVPRPISTERRPLRFTVQEEIDIGAYNPMALEIMRDL